MSISHTMRNVETFLSMFEEMDRVFQSDADWEIKYDLVLGIARDIRNLDRDFDIEYYDPDSTYEEDTVACYEAYAELAERYRKVPIEE